MDNYKFAVIQEKGNIEYRGNSKDEEELHVVGLLEYAREKYPNADIFKTLHEKHFPSTVAFFLTEFNNVLVLNLTHYKDESISKYGRMDY